MVDSFEEAEKERGDGDALEVEMAAMPADSGKVKESTGLGSDDEKLSQVYEKSKDDETLSHVFEESKKMAQEKQKKDEAQAEEDLQATLEASKLTAVTRGLPPSPGHPEASHSWGSRLRNSSKKRSQVSPEQTPERKRRPRARQLGRAGSSPVLGSSPDWPTGGRQPRAHRPGAPTAPPPSQAESKQRPSRGKQRPSREKPSSAVYRPKMCGFGRRACGSAEQTCNPRERAVQTWPGGGFNFVPIFVHPSGT